MIGTLNEGSLHAQLKEWYRRPGDLLEQPVDGYVVDDGDPGGQQPADQQPIGALDRHSCDVVSDQQLDHGADPGLVMREPALGQQRTTVLVGDPEIVVVGSPIDPAHCGHAWSSSVEVAPVPSRPRGTVAGAHR